MPDMFDDGGRFYNPTRRHSTIGYKCAIDFEHEVGVARTSLPRCPSNRQQASEPFAAAMDEAYHLYFRTDLELFFRYVATGRRNTVRAFSHAMRTKNRARKAAGERPIANKALPRSIMPVRGAVVV